MIALPSNVRVWLACGHTGMRRGFDGLACRCNSNSDMTRSTATFSSSAANVANKRHSAYGLRSAKIAYRWHPLFGRTLQVSPHRRGKDLTCIYTDERPDLSRELPNWMFDEGYCAGMTLGLPEISIEGLNEFAAVLASLGTNRKRGAQPGPSKQKEQGCAEGPLSQSSSARSRARKSHSSTASGTTCGRADRGLGGPSAGSSEGGGLGDEGRR